MKSAAVLERSRIRLVLHRHLWIYSSAIDHVEDDPADGDIVDVRDTGNNWLEGEGTQWKLILKSHGLCCEGAGQNWRAAKRVRFPMRRYPLICHNVMRTH